jgi:hypothetical protein
MRLVRRSRQARERQRAACAGGVGAQPPQQHGSAADQPHRIKYKKLA